MNCLLCQKPMTTKMYEGVIIDQCACGGTWLDWGELGPIIESREESFDYEQRIATVKEKGTDHKSTAHKSCPKCASELKTFQYAINTGVFLDRCPNKHGIWFDPNELEKVQVVMEEFDKAYSKARTKEAPKTTGIKKCPRCRENLYEISYEGLLLDYCKKCEGHWCDKGELSEVLKRRDVKFSADDHTDIEAKEYSAKTIANESLVSELPCVYCGSIMKRANYQYTSGIIIDRCQKGHGIWLDKGEIDRLQVFVERWEKKDQELVKRHRTTINLIKGDTEKKHAKMLDDVKVSRFGFMNRMARSIIKR